MTKHSPRITVTALFFLALTSPSMGQPLGEDDDQLTLLRIHGDPSMPGGRRLSMNATNIRDGSGDLQIAADAQDGTSPIIKLEIWGNNKVIASCSGSPCNYRWPYANMNAGNNELMMVYTRVDMATFQTYGRIARPTKKPTASNYLLCGTLATDRCTTSTGELILAQ